MPAKSEPVALMFREVSPDEWCAKQCHAKHVPYYQAQGWTLLIAEVDVRDRAIADTYQVEIVQWDIRRRERL